MEALKRCWSCFVGTEADAPAFVLRWTLAIVFFPHGAQKVFGWFGGRGFEGTIAMFREHMGLAAPLAVLVMVAELGGSIALALGFLGRLAAFGIGVVMVVAIFMVHAEHGFFMNWSGREQGEGFEYHILALGITVAVMVKGSGAWSIDRALAGGGR